MLIYNLANSCSDLHNSIYLFALDINVRSLGIIGKPAIW